jgi:hypothetical protein
LASPMAKVKYEPMLVSYVDILGFGELINTKTAGEISRLLRIFNETTAPYKFKDRGPIPDLPDEDQVSFSDLILTCTPLRRRGDRDAVSQQFMRLVHAQAILMLDEDILIRGGGKPVQPFPLYLHSIDLYEAPYPSWTPRHLTPEMFYTL